MSAEEAQPAVPKPNLRWFRLTPDRFMIAVLVVECLLWLSERLRWFPFNHHKGWTVLFAAAVVGVAFVFALLWVIASLVFRWGFQFSIRSLLVLTVAVAIPCSWMAVEMKKARRAKEIVATICRRGGEINLGPPRELTDDSWRLLPPGLGWLAYMLDADLGLFLDIFAVDLPANPGAEKAFPLDGVLEQLHELDGLRYLVVEGQTVSDTGLERIGRLTQLQELRLIKTDVTNAGLNGLLEELNESDRLQKLFVEDQAVSEVALEHIGKLTKVRELYLMKTNLTNAGLTRLAGLEQLQGLSIGGTKVTDSGLKQLKGLSKLQWLSFFASGSGTDVSDAGLEHLAGMKRLQELNLRGTKVTKAGVAKLQLALPRCRIDL